MKGRQVKFTVQPEMDDFIAWIPDASVKESCKWAAEHALIKIVQVEEDDEEGNTRTLKNLWRDDRYPDTLGLEKQWKEFKKISKSALLCISLCFLPISLSSFILSIYIVCAASMFYQI